MSPVPPAPFVVGVPRSGTTLLRLMLDAHPEMAIPPETYFVNNVIRAAQEGAGSEAIRDLLVAHRRWDDIAIDAERLLERLGPDGEPTPGDAVRAIFTLYAEQHGKRRWGDKTPAYLTNIEEIGGALPEARFVHIIRDGRDVALSILAMPERDRPMRCPQSAGEVAGRWDKRIRRARRQAEHTGRYLEVRYEQLVVEPEATLRGVCEFVELDFRPAMLDYHRGASDRLSEMNRELAARGELPSQPAEGRIAPHRLASAPPQRERLAVWRDEMSEPDRAAFEAAAGELLAELGYPVGDEALAAPSPGAGMAGGGA
jgi:hypothetical protein